MTEAGAGRVPHFPRPAPIDAYGGGGFRFAGMSHRGSLLCLPSGIYGWLPRSAAEIDEAALAPVLNEADAVRLFLLGTGTAGETLPAALRESFMARRIGLEVTSTGNALRTYNILVGEGRSVACGLIAVS